MPSTAIRRFEYLADTSTLDITFVSGRRYRYRKVPHKLFEEMRAAFSKGEFFNRHIRDHFAFERIDEESPAFAAGHERKLDGRLKPGHGG